MRRWFKAEAQSTIPLRSNDPRVEVVVSHYVPGEGFAFRTTLGLPLSQARELRADLEAAIIRAEARL